MFAPPRTVPEEGTEATQARHDVKGPLRTSWGSTLQSLSQVPHHTDAVDPQQGAYQLTSSAGNDAISRNRPAVSSLSVRFDRSGTEMWLLGQSNGWFQPADRTPQDGGWVSDGYLASIDDLNPTGRRTNAESPSARVASPSPQKPSHAARAQVRLVAAPKSPRSGQTAGPDARASDAVDVGNLHRRRGRLARGGDERRGRGLFGFFRGRKAERTAWSVGSAPPDPRRNDR